MTNASKAKGTHGESAVVNWHHANGRLGVERLALAGIHDRGDLTGVPGLVQSIKFPGRGKPTDLSGWLNELSIMRANVHRRHPSVPPPAGVLIVRRVAYPSVGDWYAVQTLESWWQLWEQSQV